MLNGLKSIRYKLRLLCYKKIMLQNFCVKKEQKVPKNILKKNSNLVLDGEIKNKIVYKNKSQKIGLMDAIKIIKKNIVDGDKDYFNLTINLNIDPRKSNQILRSKIILPHGHGKQLKVAIFCDDEEKKIFHHTKFKIKNDFMFGNTEIIKFISEKKNLKSIGFFLSTIKGFKFVGSIMQKLGKRGMLPNVKYGTIIRDLVKFDKNNTNLDHNNRILDSVINNAVKRLITVHTKKCDNLSFNVGKSDLTDNQIYENIKAAMDVILIEKPKIIRKKGYVKSVFLKSSYSRSYELFCGVPPFIQTSNERKTRKKKEIDRKKGIYEE